MIINKDIITQALNMIREQAVADQTAFTQADTAIDFITLKIAHEERESFLCLFLTSQRTLIADEVMFQGTINAAAVYPREIVKRALQLNAAAIIIAHNHPSGYPEPSQADITITERIKNACGLLDISLLDHIIVSSNDNVSFAKRGLL